MIIILQGGQIVTTDNKMPTVRLALRLIRDQVNTWCLYCFCQLKFTSAYEKLIGNELCRALGMERQFII